MAIGAKGSMCLVTAPGHHALAADRAQTDGASRCCCIRRWNDVRVGAARCWAPSALIGRLIGYGPVVAGIRAEVEQLVLTDYRMFGFGDRETLGSNESSPWPGWIGLGRTRFLVRVSEDLVRPMLRIEHWDEPAPEPPAGFEVQESMRLLFPTGTLLVHGMTVGVTDVLEVRPGTYAVRVTGWERERTSREFAQLSAGHPGGDGEAPEFVEARAALEGQERYLVQLWLETASSALVDRVPLRLSGGEPVVTITAAGVAVDTEAVGARIEWLSVCRDGVLIQLAHPDEKVGLELQLWDGEPPLSDAKDGQETTVMRIPSYGVQLGRQHDVRRIQSSGGVSAYGRPFILDRMSGDHHVRVTGSGRRGRGSPDAAEDYLVQFWPA